ncbi:MAG: glucose 1-dehydrogenase [Candidatus Thorarchaeota archaeon]|nr:glucose 1-dehydrogenase [Candidatus Thorarchaeota archaeon]
MTDYDLQGKTAIVTGASGGLGEQFCIGLAASGADIVLSARRENKLKRIANEISSKHGVTALPLQTDVTKESDIIRMIDYTVDRLGTVDILINNAGVYVFKPLTEQTIEDWRKVIDVNLTSTFLGCREAAKIMIPNKSGCIINISSTFGLGATEFPEVGYYAAKGGVIALTKALAVELGEHNIRVNSIAPGFFPTDMSIEAIRNDDIRKRVIEPRTALPMLAKNEWIRGAACFLASDDAQYITGHTLAVDGGWLAF